MQFETAAAGPGYEVGMPPVLLVALGGALGSVLRWLVGTALNPVFAAFPLGTFLVNLLGSAALAAIGTAAERGSVASPGLALFLTTGVMGGFTTYSSFNWEVARLFRDGQPGAAVTYLGATMGCCLAGAALGAWGVGRGLG